MLDHLILGINNLQKGIQDFYQKTGVQPIFGGEHPGIGTHNALVSLGDGKYLEIIAPVDNSKPLSGPFQGLNNLEELTPVGWVIGSKNLEEIAVLLNDFKIENSGILPLSRKTADGGEIHWKNIFLLENGAMSVNPFFIQWEIGGVHPSEVTPKGCTLLSYKIGEFRGDVQVEFLKKLDLGIEFESVEKESSSKLLSFELSTAKCVIQF